MKKNVDSHKSKLIDWTEDPESVTPYNIDSWHIGRKFSRLPSKVDLKTQGLLAITKGWLPKKPIINANTRVLGLGSCFASNFILWLAENGFNRLFPESPYNALLTFGSGFENAAVIAQQFRWAFGELNPDSVLWIDKDKQIFEATEKRRTLIRETLEKTDVIILTLGVSEIWYDSKTGEPLWRALTKSTFDPTRHIFRVETVGKTIYWLETIERIRKKYLPKLKVIYTVSPVKLKNTFRPISAISANSVSKAILRSALDEFLRGQDKLVNHELFYFPSYEIVYDFFRDPFEEDNRHVCSYIPTQIIKFFAEHFCEKIFSNNSEEENCDVFTSELLARISELEQEVKNSHKVADQRLAVIEELDKAAKERLLLVNRLNDKVQELKSNK